MAGASAANQAVLYTAHYDHLGIDPDAKGDDIYNGAADNGTGCGILLELARAFAQSPVRPPHAVYFASVTAEEQGLLGSQYLGMHPPVPAGQIALDLNYDMLLPIGIPRSVSLGGAERIDFWPTVQTVAKAFDLALLPDPNPWRRPLLPLRPFFAGPRRAFPPFPSTRAISSKATTKPGAAQQAQDYVKHHYHQPSDEYRADWDFRGNAKLARFGFVLGWLASEQPKTSGMASRRRVRGRAQGEPG